MRILVTGAAGYIGSVVAERLLDEGHSVVALDDLRYGHRAAVHPNAEFIQADILDRLAVDEIFDKSKFDAVVHLAAEAYIDESIRDPGKFFSVNVTGGINLLEPMRKHGINKMVFSSTAAVYGQPKEMPIHERTAKEPVNAYGESKLQFERIMRWYRLSCGLNHVSLRYFNACGATERCGEARKKETHILPILFDVATGKREKFSLFGNDYQTKDGTCVRDYIHVADIADAHILALEKIESLGERAYNLGSGSGYTNLEVVESVRRVTGHPIPFEFAERRPGDPDTLIASSELIRNEIGWKAQYDKLDDMVESAWKWRLAHPGGYSA